MFMQTGKGSLMQRLNSPTGGPAKPKNPAATTNSLNFAGSTMAGTMNATTQSNTQAMSASKYGKSSPRDATMSSPFKDSIARGIIKGVGLFNKGE